jgi:hypothetical protein
MEGLKDKAFIEVHRSNMTKFYKSGGGLKCIRDDAGKIIKPSTYDPPNLKQFFEEKPNESKSNVPTNMSSDLSDCPIP